MPEPLGQSSRIAATSPTIGEAQTLLVEVNDAYSLGHVGLRPVPYADMLEDRWPELVAGCRPVGRS